MSSSCFPGQVHANEFKECPMMRLQYLHMVIGPWSLPIKSQQFEVS